MAQCVEHGINFTPLQNAAELAAAIAFADALKAGGPPCGLQFRGGLGAEAELL